MCWHYVGLTLFVAAIVSGCAAAPVSVEPEVNGNQSANAEVSVTPGASSLREYLYDTDPESLRRCRKEAPTGSNVKRTQCRPPRDDRELLPLITSPPVSL